MDIKRQILFLVMILVSMIAKADESGTCGENLTWTLEESTGILTISGSGSMKEYDGYESVPWYSHREKITKVVVDNGVSTIGKCAFYGCTKITTASIPNSVSSLSNYAFYGCSSLTSVNIPNGVTSIGYLGFSDCTSLKTITLPESLTRLGEFTFSGCSSLSVVTVLAITPPTCYNDFSDNAYGRIFYVPANSLSQYKRQWKNYSSYIYYIGENAGNCGESVTYSFDESTGLLVVSGEGAMYDFDGYEYPQTPWKSYSASIKSLIIQDGVTSIGGNAFSECRFLNSIEISNSVVDISAGALTGTAWYDNQPDGLIYAGKIAYSYKGEAPDNTEVNIKEGTISIAAYAFFACSGLTSVTIPNSVTTIGNNAFDACKNLTSVNIPKNVTAIEPYTFENCSSLNTITIPYSVTTIGGAAFHGCSSLTSVKISDGVTSIGNNAFSGCRSIISITIPYSVTTIGKSAFSGCQGLLEIILPNNVTSIGDGAFSNCSNLTSIDIPRNLHLSATLCLKAVVG